MIVLVATEDEYRLASEYLKGYEIIMTGVGAGNVIRTCSELLLRPGVCGEKIVNVGFCGSNSVDIGTVVKVSKSWRLMDNTVKFNDWNNGYELCDMENALPCYTSNSFVTSTGIEEPCLFDMELNYIVSFIPHVFLNASVKIVSDNLCLDKYEHTIRHSEAETWEEVRKILETI